MDTATIRIPEGKKNLLKAVASLENRKMNDILVDLIDEYVERRQETLELLAIPGLLKKVRQAERENSGRASTSLWRMSEKTWTVVFSRNARKSLQGMETSVHARLLECLDQLSAIDNPLRHKDVRGLEGKYHGYPAASR